MGERGVGERDDGGWRRRSRGESEFILWLCGPCFFEGRGVGVYPFSLTRVALFLCLMSCWRVFFSRRVCVCLL